MKSLETATCDNTPIFTIDIDCISRVLHVQDGDTVQLAFDQMGKIYRFNARLLGINTSELNSSDKISAIAARCRLLHLCSGAIPDETCLSRSQIQQFLQDHPAYVHVKSNKFDSFGRLLADLRPVSTVNTTAGNLGESFSDILLRENLAKPYVRK